MKTTEYAHLAEQESKYWWHIGRLKIIEVYMKQATRNKSEISILNIGCGTGGTIKTLEKFGRVNNVDTSDEALKFMRLQGHNRVTKVDGTKLPFKKQTYDIVVAFDVLEHIKADKVALEEWRRVLKDDGEIVLTVPAYQWLWSGHDVVMHHYRRYQKDDLRKKAALAGLTVTRASYAFIFTFLLIAGYRLAKRVFGHKKAEPESSFVRTPGPINWAFIKLLYAEAQLHRFINLPFGTSIIVRLRKV